MNLIAAWLLNVAMQSVLLLIVACLIDRLFAMRNAWRELLWRAALFGGVSITGSRFGEGEMTRRTVAAFAGYSRPLKGMDGLEACAIADYAHGWLFGGREDVFSMGAAIGRTIAASPTLDVVPFGDLRLHSSNRGTLAVGAGIVFSKSLTVRANCSALKYR